jgi:HEAT repeat protein
VGLQQAVCERLTQRVGGTDYARLSGAFTNALFGAEVLELVLKHLNEHPENVKSLVPILATLSPNELPTMLNALRLQPPIPTPVRDAIVSFVERILPGREVDVGNAAIGIDPETSGALLALLGRANTPQARQVLQGLQTNEDVNVRIEAKVLSSGNPEQAHGELGQMLENPSALVRMAALRAIARYRVKATWPAIARTVKAPQFNELGLDERRELLRALIVLSPQSGEPIALELAKKGGIIASEEREATRVAAIEALGKLSRSPSVSQAMHEISQSRWGTSDETRAAAGEAARAINLRIREGAAQ